MNEEKNMGSGVSPVRCHLQEPSQDSNPDTGSR